MDLFRAIPENLFSILASKNKAFYVDALFVLRSALKQEMTVEKSDLISRLVANLDESAMDFDLSVEDEDYAVDCNSEDENRRNGDGSLSTIAHLIVRRFVQTGWIETELQMNSFEEVITAPAYTRKLLDLLYSFTDETATEYNSYVYSTYSVLRTADQERNEFTFNAFLTAYDNTVNLVDELKNLFNNIRRYHQNLNDYASANEVLHGHFDQYKTLLLDRIYHPLKTLDAVPRFKVPILQILNSWMHDLPLREQIAEQGRLRGKYASKEEGMENVILKISEITDYYENMDHLIEEIDQKNAAYTRASMEKMRYLLNTDRSIKGKLVEILTAGDDNLEALKNGIRMGRQGYLTESSLFVRRNRNQIRNQKPDALVRPEEGMEDKGMVDFLERARKLYSNKRVMEYMKTVLDGRDIVYSQEINITDIDGFILLLLGTSKQGEQQLFYEIEFEEGYCERGGYRIPNMCIIKKKQKED